MSDVKQGGSTVFINAMATAYPSKRAAVMWFNTFSDGSRDPATDHGACPVIMGEKWGKISLNDDKAGGAEKV